MMRKRAPIGSPWRSREDASLLLGSVLWVTDRLRAPLAASGVDYPMFRELLRTRVLLALRPSTTASSAAGVTGIVIVVLMSWLAGLASGLLALISHEPGLWPGVQLSILLLLHVFFLLQALVGMLIDPDDVRVLAPHPVTDRTLFAVRLAHVFAFLLVISAGFVAGNVALAVFRQPVLPTLLVYPLLAGLTTLVALGGVALFFTLLLRLVGPTHFQRIALWAQIGSAVLLVVGMQVLARVLPEELLQRAWEARTAWKLAWPPAQCAAAYDFVAGDHSRENVLGLVLALLTPAAALIVTLQLASRSYVAALEGKLDLGRPARTAWSRGMLARLAQRLRLGREQRAAFDFALALSRREPHVLRTVLPQFVSFQAMAVAMGLGTIGRHGPRGLGIGFYECYSAGLLALAVPNILTMCQGTPTPEARWVFQSTPVSDEAELVRGSTKGLLVGWVGAALLVVGVVQVLVAGVAELPRIALALELAAVLALVMSRFFALGVPFTREVRKAEGLENLGIVMGSMLGLGALGGLHWALSLHWIALALGLVAGALAIVHLWRALDRMKIAEDRRLTARAR